MPRRSLQFQQEQAGHMLTSWRRGEVALIVESVTRERALPPRNTDDVSILRCITGHQHDLGQFSPIPHRDRAACATFARLRAASRIHPRTHRTMVGRQGRLDASTRIYPAGRRRGRFVGSRLPSSQGRRPEQRILLVSSGWKARVPKLERSVGQILVSSESANFLQADFGTTSSESALDVTFRLVRHSGAA
jgi:hypothetical protein